MSRVRDARRRAAESGSSAAEMVIVLPVLMLVVALVTQLALWGLASHAVQAAASTAGDVARSRGGTTAAAVASGRAELGSIAPGLVGSPDVVATVTSGGVSVVVVSGAVPTLIPGLHLRVSANKRGAARRVPGSG